MDLIPVGTDSDSVQTEPGEITFTPEAIKLMEIQTSPVERKFVDAEIRMVGKVEYDETKLKHVTAWTGGRIDRLFVDFEGTEVIKGDHMVRLYSPDLISAQAEYLQALKSVNNMSDKTSELIRKSNNATLKAAGEKLLLMGLTEPLEQGDVVTITLTFEKAGPLDVDFKIEAAKPAKAHEHHGG